MKFLAQALRSDGDQTTFYRNLQKVQRALGAQSGGGESVVRWSDTLVEVCADITSGDPIRIEASLERLRALGEKPPEVQKRDRAGVEVAWEKVLSILDAYAAPVGSGAALPGDGLIADLAAVEAAVREATRGYVRETVFVRVPAGRSELELRIKDILVLGALTGSDVLLVGRTGNGKTKLAVHAMEGLFGTDGFYSKTTLPSMSPSDFMDIDFRSIREGRKSLKEAIEGVPALTRPGIVINEANRAPSLVQAMLIPFLDREFEIEGKPVDVGVAHAGRRYQFRVLTINEGELYAVEALDRAIRDRAVIEVPVDLFPQTQGDVWAMLEGGDEPRDARPSMLEAVLRLHDAIRRVPVSDEARGFLVYLSNLGNCVRSPTGTKEGIAFTPRLCEGCRHVKHFYGLCAASHAPSPRSLVNLQRVAQGAAFLRSVRVPGSPLEVGVDDVVAVSPLVLLNKLELADSWLRTAGPRTPAYHGCAWLAILDLMAFLRSRHSRVALEVGPDVLAAYARGTPLESRGWEKLGDYASQEDAWAANLLELAARRGTP